MKSCYFILYLALVPSAFADGIGVSPNSLSFENVLEGKTYYNEFTIFNENNFSMDYRISNNEFLFDKKNGTIKKGSYEKIKVGVNRNIENDTLIIVEFIGNKNKGYGLIPAAGIKVFTGYTKKIIENCKVYKIYTEDGSINGFVTFTIGTANLGNIAVKPRTEISIVHDNVYVDFIRQNLSLIQPGEKKDDEVYWSTADLKEGMYKGIVKVFLDNKLIEKKEAYFNLNEETINGRLINLSMEGRKSVGSLIKINALFENNETISKARLVGDVYLGGKLLTNVYGDDIFVKNKEELSAYYKIEKAGSYTIKGRVVYNGKLTEQREVNFKANGNLITGFSVFDVNAGDFGLLAIIVALMAAIYFMGAKMMQ